MDQRMSNAARSGDVKLLHQLLNENPFILFDYALLNPHENPLTIATKANQLVFVSEVLKLRPELAREPNQDGVRPLDVASAYGNLEIVREILSANGPEICQLAGRDGMTAIHYAAENGKVEIIDELILACSASAKDVTSFGETVLHLAVKCFRLEALRSMLEKADMVEVVNLGDREGNTVLHYAVLRKQLASVELLLDWNKRAGNNSLEVNAVNKKGQTAMDIMIEPSRDIQLREMLRCAGGHASSESHNIVVSEGSPTPTNNRLPVEQPKKWEDILKHFEFQWQRDSPGEARATLLLIAALIATVTFQAGINPPPYLSETKYGRGRSEEMRPITVFFFANSVALSASTCIIDYLTGGLPYQRELSVSMFFMMFAYGFSLSSVATGRLDNILLTAGICAPIFVRWLPDKIRKRNRRN